MKLSDMTRDQQAEHLVSTRDRMVSVYRQTGNPQYKDGRELIATVTVSTDPDGCINIGLGSTGSGDATGCTDIEVDFIVDADAEDAS